MDIQKSIRMAVDTGEVLLGKNEAMRSLNSGSSKLIVLASNAPADFKIGVRKKAQMVGIPLYEFEGTSTELGSLCGKPYPIMMMAVIKEGDSDIMSLAKQ